MADVVVDAEINQRRLRASIAFAERQFDRGFNRIRNAIGGALAAAAAGFTTDAIVGQIRNTTEAVREMERAAREFGLTNEQFQRLEVGAAQAGLQVDRLGDFYKDFVEKLGEAQNELSGELNSAFELLGLDPRSFENAEEALTAFLNSIEPLSTQAQRALQAMVAEAGTDLDLSGLRALEQSVLNLQDTGELVILSDEQIRAMAEVDGRFENIANTFRNRFAESFLDDISASATQMQEIDRLAGSIGSALGDAGRELLEGAEQAAGLLNRLLAEDQVRRGTASTATQLDVTQRDLASARERFEGLGEFGQATNTGRELAATIAELELQEEGLLAVYQHELEVQARIRKAEEEIQAARDAETESIVKTIGTVKEAMTAFDELAESFVATARGTDSFQDTLRRQRRRRDVDETIASLTFDDFVPEGTLGTNRNAVDVAIANAIGEAMEGNEEIQEAASESARFFYRSFVNAVQFATDNDDILRNVLAAYLGSVAEQLAQGETLGGAFRNVLGGFRNPEIVGDNDAGG